MNKFLIYDSNYNDSYFGSRLKRFRLNKDDFLKAAINDIDSNYCDAEIYLLLKNNTGISDIIRERVTIIYENSGFLKMIEQLLELRKMKFTHLIMMYYSLNRLNNTWREVCAFCIGTKTKLSYEASFVEILRKHSFSFNKSNSYTMESYSQLLDNYTREQASLAPSFNKKIFSFFDISLIYTLINVNFRRVIFQNIERLWYFICLILGSLFLLIKNCLRIKRLRGLGFDLKFNSFFYCLPSYVFAKTAEGRLFNNIKISSPSLEIGIEGGEISGIIFKKSGRFDCGLEYYYPTLPDKNEVTIFRNLLSGDINNLPFKDQSFSTVVLVHTMDHFENIERPVSEISRITKNGGKVVFSCYSEYFRKLTITAYLYNKLKLDNFTQNEIERFSHKYKTFNFFSINDWQKIFSKHGMKLELYTYFVSKFNAVWMTNLEHFGYHIGHLFPTSLKYKKFFENVSKILLYPYFLEENLNKEKQPGTNIFCVFSKA